MQVYKTKAKKFKGSNFGEVYQQALGVYRKIKRKTKRRPYIKSMYFNKRKIFLDFFWHHLFEKQNWRDRMRRMKYFACAIELIQKSTFEPISKENPNKRGEMLHRFCGLTAENELFYVQIKEDKRNKQHVLISVFPEQK